MTRRTEARLVKALRLERSERAALASKLPASLDRPRDRGARAVSEAEVTRGVEPIGAGSTNLEPWEHATRRIETEILDR